MITEFVHQFRKVERLGIGTPILLVVKNMKKTPTMAEQRRIFRKEAQYGKSRELLIPLREKLEPGFVTAMPLCPSMDINHSFWKISGMEPRGFDRTGNTAAIGFANEIQILNLRRHTSVEISGTINDLTFKGLHTVFFCPWQLNLLLVSNAGLNNIFEIDVATHRITWEWSAFKNGYAKNILGIHLFEKGVMVDDDITILSSQEAIKQMQQDEKTALANTSFGVRLDLKNIPHPLGLEKWQNTAAPNYAGYYKRDSILATLFFGNVAILIDRATGRARSLFSELARPHGVIPFGNSFIISDTRQGRVILLNTEFEPIKIFNFSEVPFGEEPESDYSEGGEWLQYTAPIGEKGLLATVDSQRSSLFVWDPAERKYSQYPFNKEWIVQSISQYQAT